MGGANCPGLGRDRVPGLARCTMPRARPLCGHGMRRMDMTQEDDELVMHLECPECGHNRKRPLSRGDGLAYFMAKGRTPLPRPHVWLYRPIGYHR